MDGCLEWKDFVNSFLRCWILSLKFPRCRPDSLPAEPPGGVPRGDPKQAEIQISAPYRLCFIQSPMAVVAMLRDPPQVNETFILPPPLPHQTLNPQVPAAQNLGARLFYPLDQLQIIKMPTGIIRQICTLIWIIKSCFQQQVCIQAIGSLQVKQSSYH